MKPVPVAGFTPSGRTADKITDAEPPLNERIVNILKSNQNSTYILPYKMPKIYDGEKEQFIHFNYYSRTAKKYLRKKIFPQTGGLRLGRFEKLEILRKALPEIKKELINRNNRGIYHEDVTGEIGVEGYIEQLKKLVNRGTVLKRNKRSEPIPETTLRTLKNYIGNFESFVAVNPEYKGLTPNGLNTDILEDFSWHLVDNKGLKGKSINSYLWAAKIAHDYLHSMSIAADKLDISSIRLKHRKNESEKYRPLTSEEKTKIFEYFKEHKVQFLIFISCIYYSCIRPSELLRLKLKHFNFERKIISPPGYTSKNGLSEHVQMLKPLYNLLIEQGYNKLNPELFIFSKDLKPGKEKRGRDATTVWRLHCNKINIPKDAYLYGLKHTFNVDYVEGNKGNIDWEWLRRHNRHATKQQTQDYIRVLSPYFLDENTSNIIDYTS